jgi:hypothetical protein
MRSWRSSRQRVRSRRSKKECLRARKCERMAKLLKELRELMPMENAAQSLFHLASVCTSWKIYGRLCGNPKCSSHAGSWNAG